MHEHDDCVQNDVDVNSDDFVFGVSKDAYFLDFNIGGIGLAMMIDSGASCNILDENTWKMLKTKNTHKKKKGKG